jgi:hypothetical protein
MVNGNGHFAEDPLGGNKMGRTLSPWLLLALLAPAAVQAGQFLLATHTGGVWTLEEADAIQVNGKDKVRSVALSTTHPDTWDPKAISHLADAPLASYSAILRAPDGNLLAAGESGGWQLLLPDGAKNKAAQSPAELWRSALVTVKKERKDKAATTLVLGDLYAIIPGQDPSLSAARLATDFSIYKLPGVDDSQAFRQMLELIPPAVKRYSTGAAADKMREYVRSAMATRRDKWADGDAPVTVLGEWLALAKVSETAYAGDATQADLRKQAVASKQWLDRKVAILRALHAGKQADAFLTAYREFEPYDKSFADLAGERRAHLQESALAHLDAARQLRQEGDYANAIRHLRLAQVRNPELAEAGQLLEEVRLEIARLSAQKFAEARRGIDPRSPAQVQLQRKLLLAEQYMNDGKQQEAEQALRDADAIDKDEPKITLGQARLALARGDFGMALALLDLYAGMAVTPQDFAEGEKLRASVQYKIDNTRTEVAGQLKSLYSDQHFASALQASANGLKLDNEEPAFLFQAGVNASLLRHGDDAVPLLHRYLDLSDSTQANREQRLTTLRLLRELSSTSSTPVVKPTDNRAAVSWFSGAALDRGVFYDPVSLAFQPKVVRVSASNHLTVNYDWNGSQLRSVHTRYEEKKTGSNIAKLAIAGAAASQGLSIPVNLRTTGRETNDFYFNYYDDVPQIFKVSRDNVVVKSQKIPVMLPAFPGFGPFGGIGAIGSLANLGRLGLMGGGLKGLTGLGGLGRGMPGLSGLGGMSGMPGLSAAGGFKLPGLGGMGGLSSMGGGGGMGGLTSMGQFLPGRNYSVHADPDGGSTSGYLTLWNSPRLDTRLAYLATGKRVAIGFSGNRYFHPFIWDAIHFFELDYDDKGRVSHAWELDEPNAPRLDFSWEGKKLMSVVGHGHAEEIVYSRTLSYSGDRLVSEAITQGGKASKIQYKYSKQGALLEAECETDNSIDGRSRKVEFLDETADKGKR